jgi:hypothetical protein
VWSQLPKPSPSLLLPHPPKAPPVAPPNPNPTIFLKFSAFSTNNKSKKKKKENLDQNDNALTVTGHPQKYLLAL